MSDASPSRGQAPPVDRRRRRLLGAGALGAMLPLASAGAGPVAAPTALRRADGRADWAAVRAEFRLDPGYVHLAGLLLASHPGPVHRAIARHRDGLDDNPALYVDGRWSYEHAARRTAAGFLGVRFEDLALCPSTTAGLGLLYAGLSVRPDQELLTTEHDYYATLKSLEYKRRSTGARLRRVRLFDAARDARPEVIVERIRAALGPRTRVLALTWVHSSTGLKLPLNRIAAAVAEHNAAREPEDRVLLCVDGVHGLGVEDFTLPELGCDFFVAGTHKWMFGPRGTAILWGRREAQPALSPVIPTFTADGSFGGRLTPGGFKAFEHLFALPDAFVFHERIGRANIQARIRSLCWRLKQGLRAMRHVTLYTPMDPELSAGIVCFDVAGRSPPVVVDRLRARRIIASVTPYDPSYARLTPGIYNTPEDVDAALAAIEALA